MGSTWESENWLDGESEDGAQGGTIWKLLEHWDSRGGARIITENIFRDVDQDGLGCLDWSGNDLMGFIRIIFVRNGMPIPHWPHDVWLLHKLGPGPTYPLGMRESVAFARACFWEAATMEDAARVHAPVEA